MEEKQTIEKKNWYALYTKPRWEKKVTKVLVQKGIDCWCPLKKTLKQWSDRKKVVEEPLFTSYVFVNIAEGEKQKVLTTDGILNFVYYIGKPAVIRNEEIELIKKYLAETQAYISVQSFNSLDEKTKIKVNHGLFMDATGVVVRGGKRKVYVKLESLDQVMIVEFPVEFLSPVK